VHLHRHANLMKLDSGRTALTPVSALKVEEDGTPPRRRRAGVFLHVRHAPARRRYRVRFGSPLEAVIIVARNEESWDQQYCEIRQEPHRPNENKMSDGGRNRASLGVKGWKSPQM
jgi:hypothetical protein